uniref:Uncharacterized protein n=1 Tax=viral metagenome TaxID=1070528 RepID=A0A6H1ZBZ3_9ZZZZ
MDKTTFDKYYHNILRKAADKRREKESEYFSTKDLLGNFRRIAIFRNTNTPITIMDLGAKSLQSISDMVNFEFGPNDALEDEKFSLQQWDEKFVDAINYLIKLYASIREDID